jgi:hypothetical protein
MNQSTRCTGIEHRCGDKGHAVETANEELGADGGVPRDF